MSALPDRATLAGSPNKAQTQTLLLAVYDFCAQRLAPGTTGAGVATAVELQAARTGIGASQYHSVSASVAGSAMTLGHAGGEFEFRSATAGSGAITPVSAAVLALIIPSGATLGATSAAAVRYWIAVLNNAGTPELAVMNTQLAGGQIAQVNEAALISTTLLDANSDSAGVWYSAVARSNVAFRLVGYVDHTQATAGAYVSAPTFIQGMGPGVRRPGEVVQDVPGVLLTSGSASSNIPFDDTIPQSSEGALILTQPIVPTSALNYLEADADVVISEVTNTTDFAMAAVFRDSGVDALGASFTSGANLSDNLTAGRITFTTPRQRAGSTASTDFKLRVGCTSGDVRWNGYGSAGRRFGGVMPSALRIREIQV